MDFSKGKNKIIIYTNGEDIYFLPGEIRKWTLLECNDNKTIEDVRKCFVFERVSDDFVESTDSDSRIFFFKNNNLVFSNKINIEGSISLHFKNTGWTFSQNQNELIKCFSKFSPIYFPIILIHN